MVAFIGMGLAVVSLLWLILRAAIARPRLVIEPSPWSDPSRPFKFAAIRVYNRTPAPLPRLLRRRSSGGSMPPERVLRFLLTGCASFEAFGRPRAITSGSTRL